MKKLLVAVSLSLAITTPVKADQGWWELGAAAVGLGIALSKESRNQGAREAGRNAEIIMGSLGDTVGSNKEYILPYQYEGNTSAYQNWIKAPRVKNRFAPELDDGYCLYQMRAGMIKFIEPNRGCPTYIMVNPKAFY